MVIEGADIAALGAALGIALTAAAHYRRQAVLRTSVIAALQAAIVRDPLTGLLNRRGFQERMEVEVQRSLRDRTPQPFPRA